MLSYSTLHFCILLNFDSFLNIENITNNYSDTK